MEYTIALIPGDGIGLEVVRQLTTLGWRVFLTGRMLPSVRKAAASIGPSVVPVPLDITSRISIEAAFSATSQAVDHLDVLVNNAGILDHDEGSIFDLQPQRLRRMFETNTIGALLVTQKFLPLLRKSQSGRIINVSSGAGQLSGDRVPPLLVLAICGRACRLEHRRELRLPRMGQDGHGRQ